MQCTRRARAARWAGLAIALMLTVPAAAQAADTGRERLLIPSAGWHGRPIQEPIRDATRVVRADGAPRGWAAGPVSLGTGTHRATGSQRVRELQWRLTALGYRPGPIDGIFGIRTRAAVAWFQVKHGLRVDGRAGFALVRHLRDRTTPDRAVEPDERRIEAPSTRPPASEPAPAAVVVRSDPSGAPTWAVVGLALLAFALGFAVVALRRRKRPAATRGIGYVRISGEPGRRLEAHATTIEERCADHGIALAGLVTDDAADHARPGLDYALEQLAQGAADCLVVGTVGDVEPRERSGRWARNSTLGVRRDG